MHTWLQEQGLVTGTARVTEADAARARELRDALITVLLAHAGDKSTPPEAIARAEEQLRGLSTRYPLTTVVTAAGASLAGTRTGIPGCSRPCSRTSPNSPTRACGTGCGPAVTNPATSASSTGRATARPATAPEVRLPRVHAGLPAAQKGTGGSNDRLTPQAVPHRRRHVMGGRGHMTTDAEPPHPIGPPLANRGSSA
ncbi:hypothetical protein E4K10_44075 [Streptomyces sp. T1317-0309]|nr:hypothetical protein E4K10_44075 [Streptomyces sp. T1317-0309]